MVAMAAAERKGRSRGKKWQNRVSLVDWINNNGIFKLKQGAKSDNQFDGERR